MNPIEAAPADSRVVGISSKSRSVILVTGASGKTGRCIIDELISSGNATKILAHISPRAEDDSLAAQWADSSVVIEAVAADLATAQGIERVISAAKSAGVGSVIYAASGGVDDPEAIECVGLEKILAGLHAQLKSDSVPIFNLPTDVKAFRPLDDVVMGGRSASKMVREWNSNHATFTGNVTTEGGGGFAQTRASLSSSLLAEQVLQGTDGATTTTTAASINLSEYDGISIRVRGDGTMRNYKLNLKDTASQSIPAFAYQAMFSVEGTSWKTIRIPFSEFIPMRKGTPQYSDVPGPNIYASTLDLTTVQTLGIVLSLVNAQSRAAEGLFSLDVSHISAYRNEAPRFVLCSSAAVTRPFWSESTRKSRGADAVTNIPIVKLNPGNILTYKLRGENILRREAKISYAIVRPIGLNDEVEGGRKITLDQGDMLSGTMNRADLARGIVSALTSQHAAFKTFELGVIKSVHTDSNYVADHDFAKLRGDDIENVYEDEISNALKPAQVV